MRIKQDDGGSTKHPKLIRIRQSLNGALLITAAKTVPYFCCLPTFLEEVFEKEGFNGCLEDERARVKVDNLCYYMMKAGRQYLKWV